MPHAFSGDSLTCIRGGRVIFTALDFAVEAGGALLLVGPNGSGKTSLLRLMAGLGQPADGVLCRNGRDTAADMPAHRTDLHYVGHHDSAKPVLTVRENLAYWASLRSGGDIDAALQALDIANLAEVPARFLSAGQKRRLALARLVATPATLWLLDEPGVALDRDAAGRLRALIARHRQGGGMVVASTHADLGLDAATELDVSRFSATRAAA